MPIRAISPILIFPELKTIALGGVATGSIKAQEAASAAPANKGIGGIPKAAVKVINKGKTMLAVAVLEVTSVKKLIPAITSNDISIAGRKLAAINCIASQLAKSV